MPITVNDVRIDPVFAAHRALPQLGENAGTVRMPTKQDPKGGVNDLNPYPYGNDHPAAYAQGYSSGRAMEPIGYAPLDYGDVPQRCPRLWKDYNSAWDGIQQRGYTQWNYRAQMRRPTIPYPTRGYRSISHVMTSLGPTASRVRIPSFFIPTSTI